MATPGVPCHYSDAEIVEAIQKHKGRLCPAAKSLSIHYETIRKYVDRNPEIRSLVDRLRKDYDESLLDLCEDTLGDALDKRGEDMTNALKACFFVMNNKGKDRGFSPPVINQQGDIKITPSQLAQVSAEMKKHSEEKLADEK